MQAQLWAFAAVLFGVFNARYDVGLGALVSGIVVLSGLATCSVAYLMAERALRPMARRALASGVPDKLGIRTVAWRSMLAWTLGTGIAVSGIVFAGVNSFILGDDDVSRLRLQITMVVLGGTALFVGGLTSWLAARANSDPVRSLRKAVADVAAGDLNTRVDIYDGTELGILQAGFNDMVHGLRERETIRDLFGRHVGTDVARAALEGGVQLGGEVRDVAVLFVDIIGSTTLATERPPGEVVRLLNRFFDVVIDTVHEYDGWINKFEGDAALAIWGAPIAVEGRDQRILTAARVMGQRLAAEVPDLAAGIGVSAGPVVAGNVGAAERYEYTVIGDPVNEAARLTGEAKSVPTHVVANARLLDGAGPEADNWQLLEPITVRGRVEATKVCTPRG
jgi:adenylate cyclase